MIIGVTMPSGELALEPDAIVALAEAAEAVGLGSVWVADHLVVPHVSSQAYPYTRQQGMTLPPRYPFLDPMVTLAAIAARTSEILLCTGVYLLPLRHPVSNAKVIASLDRLCSGRLRLGVGLGWIREEYDAVGLPWQKRGRMFDEQIDMLRELWRAEAPRFEGEFWTIGGIGFEPKPVNGSVPLLIGGLNDAARKRAAQRGDGWHLIDVEPGVAVEMIAALARDCKAHGRDPAEVPVSIYLSLFPEDAAANGEAPFPLMGSRDVIGRKLRAYRDAGVSHVALAPRGLASVAVYLQTIKHIAAHYLPEAA